MHAARAGLNVTLIDKAKFPRFKSCGGALSNRTLSNLGPRGRKEVNCACDGVVVYSPSMRVSDYEEEGMGSLVIRTHWDHQLLLDALDAGAEVVEEQAVRTIKMQPNRILVGLRGGDKLSARYVVIADGVGLKPYKKALGFTQPEDYMANTICAEVPVDEERITEIVGPHRKLHIFFGIVSRGYGWFFPKRDYVNVGIGYSKTEAPANPFEVFDEFVAMLRERGMLPEGLELRKRIAYPIPYRKPFEPIGVGRVLLAGDAGGFVSPVTGEGLYYGTTAARIAAETIRDDMDNGLEEGLVETYKARWMAAFGEDLINYALPLANMVFKSRKRMELFVKMMTADSKMRTVVSQMIGGIINYREARRKIYRRIPLSFLKSLVH